MKLSLFLACAALTTPALAQDTEPVAMPTPIPASDAKFDWKLRLTKGQTWTQTVTTRAHTNQELPSAQKGGKGSLELDIRQTIAFKNEVLDATPAFYLLRVTYTRFETSTSSKVNGQLQKTPPLPKLTFVGLSFSIKQAPNGRVLDVIGLEEFVARQKKMLDSLAKTPAQRVATRDFLPSAATFKQSIIKNQSSALPSAPLAIGESYSYAVSVPSLAAMNVAVNGKRTLLTFDGQKSTFDESATFNVAPTQLGGTHQTIVTLTGPAAQLYAMYKYLATPNSQQVYLSKNGRIYYREAKNPTHVIWLDPPATGFRVPESAATRYRGVIGYNNRTNGLSLAQAFESIPENRSSAQLRPRSNPIPKIFMTMTGTVSGQSTVDAQSGLVLQGEVKTDIKGKMSVVDPRGQKTSLPILVTTQTTLSTQ